MPFADFSSSTHSLSELSRGETGVIARVDHHGTQDFIADRLEALGMVPGEAVRVVATGPLGGEPLVVLVGFSRFALRYSEAARVRLAASSDEACDG